MELLAWFVFLLGLGIGFVQERIEPAAIGSHFFDNGWHIGVLASSRRSRRVWAFNRP